MLRHEEIAGVLYRRSGFQEEISRGKRYIGVIDLVEGGAEIQLSQHAGDGAFGCAINIRVKDVDGLFKKYLERGLDTTGREDSPLHRRPLDQTWGVREFYVTDADGT